MTTFSINGDEQQWRTANQLGSLLLKNRLSQGHLHSRTYSCRKTRPEDGSAPPPYCAVGGWDLRFGLPWRSPPREDNRRISGAAPLKSFCCHQTWMDDPCENCPREEQSREKKNYTKKRRKEKPKKEEHGQKAEEERKKTKGWWKAEHKKQIVTT